MPKVTLIFSDGERKSFESPSDKSVLAAAHAAGIALASDCEMGDCQTCKAHLRSGRIEVDELAFVTLDDDEIAGGAVLTCVSMAREDLEIKLPYMRGQLIADKKYAMKVSGIEPLSPTTARLRGELPRNSAFTFHPGQYVNIKLPDSDEFRSYSMANAPTNSNLLEFHIRLLPDGQMSNFLRRPDIVGESVEIAGPKGVFYLRGGDKPILMIAGGTGLAPMVSILRTLAQSDGASRRITLCFGVNRPDDLYGIEELRALCKQLKNFDLRLSMVEPSDTWPGHKGFVTDLFDAKDIAAGTQAYLCGPAPMIEAARKRLTGCGMSMDFVFAEEFVPSGAFKS